MIIHTLIPNNYAIAILVTCSLGCSNIASHIHSRWFSQKKTNVILLHVMTKLAIVIGGAWIISWKWLFSSDIGMQIMSIFPAILLGFFAVKIEMTIYRYFFRKKHYRASSSVKQYRYHRTLKNKAQGLVSKAIAKKSHLKNVHEHHSRIDSELNDYHPRDIILVAILEEIIFRGYLYQLAFVFSSTFIQVTILLLTCVLFGASHIMLGKGQFLSKTILGFLCLINVVIFKSILPAIIIHAVFNLMAYCEMMRAAEKKVELKLVYNAGF